MPGRCTKEWTQALDWAFRERSHRVCNACGTSASSCCFLFPNPALHMSSSTTEAHCEALQMIIFGHLSATISLNSSCTSRQRRGQSNSSLSKEGVGCLVDPGSQQRQSKGCLSCWNSVSCPDNSLGLVTTQPSLLLLLDFRLGQVFLSYCTSLKCTTMFMHLKSI